jgi:DNA-binding HxlR family transcriptional regulator
MGKLREPLSEIANCGLPAALEAIGERWSFMILRAAFNGVRHFEEFLSEIGIARRPVYCTAAPAPMIAAASNID